MQTIKLWQSLEIIEQEFISWHHLLESSAFRAAVRRVAIENTPWENLEDRGEVAEWDRYMGAKRRVACIHVRY